MARSPKSSKPGTSQSNDAEALVKIYEMMLLTRTLDSKILSIQRQGRIGPYVPSAGEEAAMVASAYALGKDDWMISSYRELGAHLTRGTTVDLILAQLFGNSNDLLKGRQMSNSWGNRALNIVPTAAPIGAYLPLAVGIGMGAKARGKKVAVLTYFGDGGTSASDFHTAMNFAGVFHSPIVFLCRNNGWAISLPVERQTASESLAIKAEAYGFPGIQIDGNDATKVYAETMKALATARDGGGPTMIEAMTYRTGPHSTADDPSRYRSSSEAQKWLKKDPVDFLRKLLIERKLWNESQEKDLLAKYDKMIWSSIQRQEATPLLSPKELIFEDVYSVEPWFLKEEKEEVS
jgi:pyruvate dehydrogenase E1 component alpha subunit